MQGFTYRSRPEGYAFQLLVPATFLVRYHGSDLVGMRGVLWGGTWGREGSSEPGVYPGEGSGTGSAVPQEFSTKVLRLCG